MAETEAPPSYPRVPYNWITRSVNPPPMYSRQPSLQPTPPPAPPPATIHQRRRTEHVRVLGKESNPWAILRMYSAAPRPEQLPAFLEGEDMTGSVTLHVKDQTIPRVTAKVCSVLLLPSTRQV